VPGDDGRAHRAGPRAAGEPARHRGGVRHLERAAPGQPELDQLISAHAAGWSLERIAPLERSILRVGLAEMLHPDEVPGEEQIPPEGAINEAVETAKQFCGAAAPGFVNGILGSVLEELRVS